MREQSGSLEKLPAHLAYKVTQKKSYAQKQKDEADTLGKRT